MLETAAATASFSGNTRSSHSRGLLQHTHRRHYALAGVRITVDTNDSAALAMLDRAYDPLRRPASNAPAATLHASLVNDGHTLRLRINGEAIPYACAGDDDRVVRAYHATQELFARCAAFVPGTLALYGAAIACESGAIVLLGTTTVGKSVLALHLADRGAHFLGDETVLFDPLARTVRALPRRPLLREPALRFLPARLRESVMRAPDAHLTAQGRLWYALGPGDLCGIEPDETPHPVAAVVSIRRSSGEPAISDVGPDVMAGVCARRAYGGLATLERASRLRHLLANTRCLELALGEPAASARRLLEAIPR